MSFRECVSARDVISFRDSLTITSNADIEIVDSVASV